MAHADPKVGVVYLSDERKFAVLIHCQTCGADRVVRTSDLQWKSASFCLQHKPKAGKTPEVEGVTGRVDKATGKLILTLPANLKKEDVELEATPTEPTEKTE